VKNLDVLMCEQCGGGAYEEQIILCDRCDRGYHMFCLAPPLESVPKGQWLCPICQSDDSSNCLFREGGQFTMDDFEKRAQAFKEGWFGSKAAAQSATVDEMEAEFWHLVETGEEAVEVLYGADIDTGKMGSGFPTARDGRGDDPYASHPWNINNLALQEGKHGSVLRHITRLDGSPDEITGCIVPWLYIGMLYSSFCWHVEDHMFYSINYNHVGEPKVWYSIPADSADAFEAAFRNFMPKQFEVQPDLLFQLVTMLSPRVLQKAGVPVYRAVQEERNFIISYPRAYHGGFNCGLNCAEACNFAPADWLEFGRESVERYRKYRKSAVLSHEAWILKICLNESDPHTLPSAMQELLRVLLEEHALRVSAAEEGVEACDKVPHTHPKPELDGFGDDDAECAICRQYMHFTACECDCNPGYLVCLRHHGQMCECGTCRKKMLFRYSSKELEEMYNSVAERLPQFRELLQSATKGTSLDGEGRLSLESPERRESFQKWKASVDQATLGNASEEEVQSLMRKSGVYLWGGAGLSPTAEEDVRRLQGALKSALDWGDAVRAALKGLGENRRDSLDEKPDASRVLDLLALNPPPLDLEEARQLDAALCGAKTLQDRLQQILTRCSLATVSKSVMNGARKKQVAAAAAAAEGLSASELQSLVEEVQQCPVRVDGFAKAQELLTQTADWRGSVIELIPSLLQKQVSNGGRRRQRVEKPHVRELEAALEGVPGILAKNTEEFPILQSTVTTAMAWGQSVRAILASCPTADQLRALLEESESMPVILSETDTVVQTLQKAKKWRSKAGNALRSPNLKDRTEELERILSEGKSINMDLPEIAMLEARLKALERRGSIEKVISGEGGPIERNVLEGILEEIKNGISAGTSDEVMVEQCSRLEKQLAKSGEWEVKATAALEEAEGEDEEPRMSVSDLETLVTEGEALGVLMEPLSEAQERLARARSWVSRARTFMLRVKNANDSSMPPKAVKAVQKAEEEMAAEAAQTGAAARNGPALPAFVPPLSQLEKLLLETVELNLRLGEEHAALQEILECTQEWREKTQALLKEVTAAGPAAPEKHLEDLKERYSTGLELPVGMPQMQTLAKRVEGVEWTSQAQALVDFDGGGERQPLDVLEEIVNKGDSLPVDQKLLNEIKSRMYAGQEWGTRLKTLLKAGRKCKLKELEQLAASATALPVIVEGLERLQEAVTKHTTLEKRARSSLAEGGEKIGVEEMRILAKELIASPAESSVLHGVEASIAAADEWRGACRRLMVKKHSGDSLQKGLEAMAESLQKFLDIVEQGEARTPVENINGVPAPKTPDRYVYDPSVCPCDVLDGVEEKGKNPSIQCQDCKCQFHLRCLGMSQAAAKSVKDSFTCNFCESVKECKFFEVLDVHDTFFARSRRTRRVNTVDLENLASQLGNLKCFMPEEPALLRLLDKVRPIRSVMQSFIDKYPESQENGHGPTSPGDLRLAALRVSLALEVNLGDMLQPLLQSLYARGWLAQVRPELEAEKVSCLARVDEIIRDARVLGISNFAGKGDFVADLEGRAERARAWKKRVVAVTADLGVPMDDAKKVLEEVAGLGIEMPEELEAMEERCSLYCICRQPYDQARDMIECEKCGGWFHYDCVGLEPPQEDNDKHGITEKEGLQFTCPPCLAGVSLEEWNAKKAS